MIEYKFYFKDEYNNETELRGKEELIEEVNDDALIIIARALNNFINALGYTNYKKDMIFLESVTENEYDLLLDVLNESRKEREGG